MPHKMYTTTATHRSIDTYIHTYIHTDRQTDRQTDIHAYIQTYFFTRRKKIPRCDEAAYCRHLVMHAEYFGTQKSELRQQCVWNCLPRTLQKTMEWNEPLFQRYATIQQCLIPSLRLAHPALPPL